MTEMQDRRGGFGGSPFALGGGVGEKRIEGLVFAMVFATAMLSLEEEISLGFIGDG